MKRSLVEYPVFKHVMRSRDPVTITRTNPREDLRAVLEGGEQRLKIGISIVVFPQTTRTTVFDPMDFNSIGVKLAKKAGAPIVPIALKTDAWGNGRYLKDFGTIRPAFKVHFAFGKPLRIKISTSKEIVHHRIQVGPSLCVSFLTNPAQLPEGAPRWSSRQTLMERAR